MSPRPASHHHRRSAATTTTLLLATTLLAAGAHAATAAPAAPALVPVAPTTPAPVAAPALPADLAPTTEGDVTEARIAGMTILVKRVPTAELATAQLYVRGGARNWTKPTAGVEQLALQVAAQGGTRALDKVAFGKRLASLGGMVSAETGRDFSMLQAKGPVAAYDALFGLLVDAFLVPAMPASEVEVARERQIAQIKLAEEDPDQRLDVLVNQVLYKGHPYEHRAEGKVDVVKKLTAAQLSAHLVKLRETSRLVLVVVGNVQPAAVIAAATRAFAAVPAGRYAPKPLPKPTFRAASLFVEKRSLPTNYIQGMFVGPAPGTVEYAAAIALNNMLWERLFEEVRTKRNLSYSPGVRWDTSEAAVLGGIYVTATEPNTTLRVMLGELKRAQQQPLSDEELKATKAQTRTSMLMNQETTDGQASSLAKGLMLTGDWRSQHKLLGQIADVSAQDLQAYAAKYFGKLQMVMLGDPARLDAKLAKSF